MNRRKYFLEIATFIFVANCNETKYVPQESAITHTETITRIAFDETCAESIEELADGVRLPKDSRLNAEDLVVVSKRKRELLMYSRGSLRRDGQTGRRACFEIALGTDWLGYEASGPKRYRGDRRTPEGWYRISDKPWSQFSGALLVHYPNTNDAIIGRSLGLLTNAETNAIHEANRTHRVPSQDTALGGDILFHGGGSGRDWTIGCVALDDSDLRIFRGLLPKNLTNVWILFVP